MHVEKNVFDTLIGIILDIERKTKGTTKAHLDLKQIGIRTGLWMTRDGDKARKGLALFSIKSEERRKSFKSFYLLKSFHMGLLQISHIE